MFWLIVLKLLAIGQPEICASTIFGYPEDYRSGSAGKKARYLGRAIDPVRDIGHAHRSAPLGSVFLLHVPATGRWALSVTIDRGPYGRLLAPGSKCPRHGRILKNGRCWVNGAIEYRRCQAEHPDLSPLNSQCYKKGSRWNGCIDVAPAVAKLLGHDGWERIKAYRTGLWIPRDILLSLWGRARKPES